MNSHLIQTYLKEEFSRIKRSSNILYSLIENVNYGLAMITNDYVLLTVNRKMLEWFPQIDLEKNFQCYQSLYFQSRGDRCPKCPAIEAIRDRKKHSNIIETTSQQGKGACFKVTCMPIIGDQAEILGILEFAENITETVAIENKLKELEIQYRELIDSANDAIINYNEKGEVIQFNKKAQELFGYTQEEILGRNVLCLIPETKRQFQQHALAEITVTGTYPSSFDRIIEGCCIRKDGTIFPVETTYSLHKTRHNGILITAIIRDISERKISDQKLRQYTLKLKQDVATRTRDLVHSEERYYSLVETANDAIFSTDKHGTIIYFNKKAEEIYGYQREEILGKNISEIAPKDIWEMVLAGMQVSVAKTINPVGKTMESWGIKKDKRIFPVEFTLSKFEKEGEPYFTSIVRDITERKKLEQKLQEYTTNLEERVKERTYELTKSQQILNEKVAELSIINEIGEVLASTMDLEAVLDIILVGATYHHGLGFNRAFLFLLNEEGSHLEGKVAIGPSDPQEAHRIWSEILGKQLNLKEMLQSYTNQMGKVDTYVNRLVKSISIAMSGDENILIHVIKNKKSFNIKNAANNPLIPDKLIKLMGCNSFAVVPLVAKDKILGVLWADNAITKKPIEDRDVERLRTFAHNASLAIENSHLYGKIQEKVKELDSAYQELKENKDRLIRSEKLAAVGEMSAMVAHGIRNPLTAIGGFARRLLKKEGQESMSKRYLRIIVDEIDRLEGLLTEILDFVRPKELNLQSVYIHELIDNTLQIIDFELQRRNIYVERDFSPSTPKLNIDTDQLKRVFLNMFNNSIEAMPDGGTLSIATSTQDSWVKIVLADTGIGINERDMEKIFHPFFTRKSTGSGLGLAVCNQIVSIHGGHIKLRKRAPSGTIFEICLPLPEVNIPA